MIRRIDHVIAVVADVDRVRALLLQIGCPLVWDGRSGVHRDTLFSLGPTRLELLSPGAFDGWPALTDLAAHTDRSLGVRVAALDPGDLDQTVRELAEAGIQATEPQPGSLMALDAAPGDRPIACWRNSYVDGLRGLLPGLPSFLCEIADPVPDATEAPLEFVELRVGVPNPEAAAAQYERVLKVRVDESLGGRGIWNVYLGETPIRLVPERRMQRRPVELVLRPTPTGRPLAELAARLPGVGWAGNDGLITYLTPSRSPTGRGE